MRATTITMHATQAATISHTEVPTLLCPAMARKPAQAAAAFHLSFEGTVPKKRKLTDVASRSHVNKPTKSTKKVLDDHLSWDNFLKMLILL